ncbi:hypothetical protein SVIOM74S_02190 [Streptomyces violarus]
MTPALSAPEAAGRLCNALRRCYLDQPLRRLTAQPELVVVAAASVAAVPAVEFFMPHRLVPQV